MSGIVQSNIVRSSGAIAVAASGLNWVSTITTGTTLTAEAGNGYFINTTSNICTVTLPSSAEVGDQISLVDYTRTWGTNSMFIDSNGLNYQGQPDTYTVEYDTSGETVDIVYSGATKGWIPLNDDTVADAPEAPLPQKGIFAYGTISSSSVSMSNLLSSSGVIASDVTGVGTARGYPMASTYGGDKGIFAFGIVYPGGSMQNVSNLVSNSGVIASDTTGVGTARYAGAGATYGVGKAIFGFGDVGGSGSAITNLISTSGVVASDTSGVGSIRFGLEAVSYGTDKAIFAYGGNAHVTPGHFSMSNLVSNSGVVASDVTGVGTARSNLGAAPYGTDKGAFAYGYTGSDVSMKNLVSNLGVIASDVTGVGSARREIGACAYGGDKGAFAYGYEHVSTKNLMSNTGVIAADVTGVGSGRSQVTACGYSYSA